MRPNFLSRIPEKAHMDKDEVDFLLSLPKPSEAKKEAEENVCLASDDELCYNDVTTTQREIPFEDMG